MEKKQWGPVTEGASISISVLKKQFHVGEPITLCLSMKNVDHVPIRIVVRSPWVDYALDVRAPDGQSLPLLEGARRKREVLAEGSRAISQLKPGEEASGCLELKEGYDVSEPGVYRLIATREIYRKLPAAGYATAVSNALELEVIR